ncbi:MAG: type VI secretion system baseplate subunit TssE [Deltaproteobacteria bacterium]|nr:type VI secretion system baseplate subunit TssE [Deltaproteobacteria bacterium]
MGRGLLSRIKAGADSRPLDEVESITDHLRALLNTRIGESATAPEFGVIDISDLLHNFPDAVGILQRSIRQTILHYEPRLKNVSIRHVTTDDQLMLNFEIVAQLARKGSRGVIRFHTHVKPTGAVDVF